MAESTNINFKFATDTSLDKLLSDVKTIEELSKKTVENYKNISKPTSADQDKAIADLIKNQKETETLTKTIKLQNAAIEKLKKDLLDLNEAYKKGSEAVGKSTTAYKEEAKTLGDLKIKIDVLTAANKDLKKAQGDNTEQIIANEIAIKSAKKEYQSLQTEILKTEKQQKNLNELYNKTELTFKEQKSLLSALKSQYNELVVSEGKATDETIQLANKIDKLNSEILKTEKNLGVYGRQVGNYELANKKLGLSFGEVFGGVAGGLTAANLLQNGIQAIGAEAQRQVTNIKEFETAIALLSAITGSSGEDLDLMKSKIIELSNATGLSATDLATAFKDIGSAAPQLLEDTKLLGAVTEASVLLSQASGDGIVESSKAVTTAMAQFSLAGSEANNIVDALAAGSLAGSAEVGDITDSLTSFGTAAAGSNLSLNESIALIETLAEKQQKGTEAGTRASAVLGKLKAAQLGYASGTFNVRDALVEVNDKLATFGTEIEKDAYRAKIFGNEAGNLSVANILIENIDKYDEYNLKIAESGVAQRQANINNDTLAKKIAILKSEYDNFFISQGNVENGFADIAKQLVTFLTSLIQVVKETKSIEKNFETIAAPIKNIIEIFTNLGEAFGIIEEGANQTDKLTAVLEVLTFTTKLAFAPINLLTYIIKQISLGIKEGIEFWDSLNGTLKKIIITFVSITNPIVGIGLAIKELSTTIAYNAEYWYDSIVEFVDKIIDKIYEFASPLVDIGEAFKEFVKSFVFESEKIKSSTTGFNNSFLKDFDVASDILSNTLQRKAQTNETILTGEKEVTTLTQEEIDARAAAAKEANEKKLKEEEDAAAKLLELNKKAAEDKLAADEKWYEDELQLQSDNIDREYAAELTAFNDKQELDKASNDLALLTLTATEEEKSAFQKEFEKKQLTDKIAFLQDYYGTTSNKEIELLQIQLASLNVEADKQIESNKELYAQLYEAATDFFNQLADLYAANQERKIEELETKFDLNQQEIDAEQEKVDALKEIQSSLQDEELQANQNAINASNERIAREKAEQAAILAEKDAAQKKLNNIRKAGILAEKGAVIAQIALDTAASISALAKAANMNPLNAITSGGAGAIQLALGLIKIAATMVSARAAIKQLRKGGRLDGKTHEDGGIPLYEAEGGEYVVNKQSTSRYSNVIDTINKHGNYNEIQLALQKDTGFQMNSSNIIINNEKLEKIMKKSNYYAKKLLNLQKNKKEYYTVRNRTFAVDSNGSKHEIN